MDQTFANAVLGKMVENGNDPAEIQKHLDGLDSAGQATFVQEVAQHYGMKAPEVQPGMTLHPENAPTQNESMARGASASVPFQPEISGAIEKGVGKLTDLGRPDDQKLYNNVPISQLAGENRQVNKEAQAENPDAYTLGQLGGTAVASAIPGGLAGKAPGVLKTGLQILANPEVQGALTGASEAGPGNRLSGGLQGAMAAALLHVPMKLAGAGQALKEFANNESAQMVHMQPGNLKDLGPEGVQKLGDLLLNESITNKPTNLAVIESKLGTARQATGKTMEHLIGSVESSLGETPLMSRDELAAHLEAGLKTPGANSAQGSEQFYSKDAADSATKEAQQFLEQLGKTGDAKVSANDMWKLAQKIDSVGNLNRRSSVPIDQTRADMLKRMSGDLRGVLQDWADQAGVGEKWAATSEKYGLLAQAEESASNARALKMGRNPGDGMPEFTAGKLVGKLLGGPTTQGALAGASDLTSKLLQAGPKMGKWAPVLANAAARNTGAMNARHYVLMQTDPDYRERALKVLGEPNETK